MARGYKGNITNDLKVRLVGKIMNNTQVVSVFNRYSNVLLTYVIAGFPSKKETIELIIKLYK